MRAFIGPTKLPIGRDEIIGRESATIAKGDLKGEALTVEVVVALPVLAPISRHRLPSSSRPLYRHSVDVASAAHVRDQNKVEVGVTVNCEPHSTFLHAWYSVKKVNHSILVYNNLVRLKKFKINSLNYLSFMKI